MNRAEAIAILDHHLESLELLGYTTLRRHVGDNQAFEVRGETGVVYQLEVDILWDRDSNGPIRIIGSIDDGGLRAFVPLTISRLVEAQPGESIHIPG